MPVRYRCVLFDLDHTLFDFESSKQVAFGRVIASIGISDAAEVSELADQFHVVERPLWQGLENGELTLASLNQRRWQGLVDAADLASADPLALGALYLRELGRTGGLFPGARELLDQLRGSVILGMITNGYGEVQRARMKHFDFGHFFGPVVISSEIGVAKPDPRFFDAAMGQIDGEIGHDEVLVVGDSLSSDVAGAIGYGLDAAWYNPNDQPAPPEVPIAWTIRELSEVSPIVRGQTEG